MHRCVIGVDNIDRWDIRGRPSRSTAVMFTSVLVVGTVRVAGLVVAAHSVPNVSGSVKKRNERQMKLETLYGTGSDVPEMDSTGP